MATLLDAPKQPSPTKVEEFVQKQLNAARRRVRVLDIFAVGLMVGVGALAFLLATLVVDRYVETPRGAGIVAWSVFGLGAAAFVYAMLFRASRREINPYYAAREVEQTLPNAKNSLVTWVDFEDDAQMQATIKAAVAHKAAKDLKGVDLNRAIDNRKLRYGLIIGGLLAVANLVIVVLPPSRTELKLLQPSPADITVFNNQDVTFAVYVKGRVPNLNDSDAVRLRLWYNPEDPDSYEDRPFLPSETDRREFNLMIPAKQVRTGFQYQVLGGNAKTPTNTVICKILPEFVGFDVSYEYPEYLKTKPTSNNEPNLLAEYGTKVTLTVHTNREVKSGYIEYQPTDLTTSATLVEGLPESLRFTFTIKKDAQYRIWFTTTDGDKNLDPQRFRVVCINPKPAISTFDVQYDYPAYLRYKPMLAVDVRNTEIEAPRGTNVTLTAKTTRPVKSAQLQFGTLAPVIGEAVVDHPMWVRFKLPTLDKDTTGQLSFVPNTDESPSSPRDVVVRTLVDQAPTVQLTDPKEDEVTLPANGTLDLKGFATDDHGVDKLTLRMRVVGAAEDQDLAPKPYRNGMSFLRKEDNSWPTRLEYKDFVKLPALRMPTDKNWRVYAGLTVEYWLEAADNCTVDKANIGKSATKRIKIIAPMMKPDEQKNIDQKNQQRAEEQKNHEKNQDNANKQDKRDVQQPPPMGAMMQPMDGMMQDGMGMMGGMMQNGMGGMNNMNPLGMQEGMGTPPGMGDDRNDQVNKAIKDAEDAKKMGNAKPDNRTDPKDQVPPSEAKQGPKDDMRMGGMGTPATEKKPEPKSDPNMKNMDMGMEGMGGTAGQNKEGKIDPKKENKAESRGPGADMGMMQDPGENKESFGGGSNDAGTQKPDQPTSPKGTQPPPIKGTAKNEQSNKKDNAPQPKPAADKPDQQVTQSKDKGAGENTGGMGNEPPQDTAANKPKESADAGNSKPAPKDDMGMKENTGTAKSGPPMDDKNAGENRPDQTAGMGGMDDQARGDNKRSPKAEQGELERELGRMEKDAKSNDQEANKEAQRTADRLMRNPETREATRNKLDQMEKDAQANQDEGLKKKTQDLRNQGEAAAKDYDQKKPTPEKVNDVANKLNSMNEQERKDAENKLNDWQKDAQAKKDLDKEVDELKKKDRNKAENVEKAMQKNEQANAQQNPKDPMNGMGMGETPKLDPKQLAELAKNLKNGDDKTKADAKDQLQKMMNDPKARDEAKKMMDEMAKNAKTDAEKQDLANMQNEMREMAKELAKKDPPKDKPMGGNGMGEKPDPKKLEELAKQMGNGKDDQAKANAKKEMDKMLQDPKTREQAQKMMEEMAKNAKDEDLKKGLDEALKQAKEMAKNPPPKIDPQQLKDLANKMKNMDPETKKKLEELAKDPETKKKMEELAKEMQKQADTPEGKQQMDDLLNAMRAMGNQNDDSKPLAADPKNRLKAAELLLEKFKKNITDKEFVERLKWTDEQIAAWEKDQQAAIDALRKQVEKGDWRVGRDGRPLVGGGPEAIKLDPKDGVDPLRGGKYAPPTSYADAYKQFTETVTGSGKGPEPKK